MNLNRELTNEVKEVMFTHETVNVATYRDKQKDVCKPIMKDLSHGY